MPVSALLPRKRYICAIQPSEVEWHVVRVVAADEATPTGAGSTMEATGRLHWMLVGVHSPQQLKAHPSTWTWT